MTGRRFSQAIAEGDGISVIVPVDDVDAARAAERQRAEAVLVRDDLRGVRDATSLPIVWRSRGSLDDARRCGADACLLVADDFGGDDELARTLAHALELDLEPVLEVRDADELERLLDLVDPEIFVLAPPGSRSGDDAVHNTLELLAAVPAGKLAIADVAARSRDEIEELERAGIDAVIVGAGDVADFVGVEPPEV